MITPSLTAAARLAAKLLAHRQTPPDEVGDLIRSVYGAVHRLGEAPPAVDGPPEEQPELPADLPAPRRRRQRRAADAVPPEIDETPTPAPAPKLVRRAEVAAAAPAAAAPLLTPPGNGALRGVVRWFDPKSGKGMVQLRGLGDVGFEARLLAESGITRLFKGQEIEATLADGGTPARLQRINLPGAPVASPFGSGMVKSRHAKPVVVEMKREALRRAAARAHAEQVLGSNRNR
jgi:cold shock CspA family protein